MSNIKIDPPEEYTVTQQKLKKYIVPGVIGIFVVIAAIVASLIAVFYPQNFNGNIIDEQSQQ